MKSQLTRLCPQQTNTKKGNPNLFRSSRKPQKPLWWIEDFPWPTRLRTFVKFRMPTTRTGLRPLPVALLVKRWDLVCIKRFLNLLSRGRTVMMLFVALMRALQSMSSNQKGTQYIVEQSCLSNWLTTHDPSTRECLTTTIVLNYYLMLVSSTTLLPPIDRAREQETRTKEGM